MTAIFALTSVFGLWVKWTEFLILGIALLVIVWDIIAIKKAGPGASVSVRIHEQAKRWLIIPFGLGLVMGHFFWSVCP